jgi:AraC-like DNA-binding protein
VLQFVALENQARTSGAGAALARLSDLIVIQAVRAQLADLPPSGDGWLSALADAQLGAALRLIHDTPRRRGPRPGSPHRRDCPGLPSPRGRPVSPAGGPLQYLTYWRMQHAQRLLRTGNAGIAQIAAHVGYQTEPAFSRAFQHQAGIASGACRRGR